MKGVIAAIVATSVALGACESSSGDSPIPTQGPSYAAHFGACQTRHETFTCEADISNYSNVTSDYKIVATIVNPSGPDLRFARVFARNVPPGDTKHVKMTGEEPAHSEDSHVEISASDITLRSSPSE
jgi:hypothetical protein